MLIIMNYFVGADLSVRPDGSYIIGMSWTNLIIIFGEIMNSIIRADTIVIIRADTIVIIRADT